MKTDHPLKQLVTTFIAEFAAWWLQAEVQSVTSRSIELPADAEAIQPDQVFHVILTDGRVVILHVEFQGRRSHKPMPWRMLEYLVRLAILYRAHLIHSVVVYVGHGAGRTDTGQYAVQRPDGTPALAWNYQVLRLWEMHAEDLLALQRPALLALIGQTRINDPGRVLPQVLAQFRTEGDPERQQRLLTALVALIEDEELLTMVEQLLEEDELLLDTPFMRRIRLKAEEKGRTEGHAEGAVTALCQAICNILSARFSLTETERDELQTRLSRLTDAETLQHLVLTAMQVSDIAAFQATLDTTSQAAPPATEGDAHNVT